MIQLQAFLKFLPQADTLYLSNRLRCRLTQHPASCGCYQHIIFNPYSAEVEIALSLFIIDELMCVYPLPSIWQAALG